MKQRAARKSYKGAKEMEQLITNREFCQMFAVSRVTAWRYRRDGILPYVKLGKEIRHTREQVESFIVARSRIAPTQETGKEN